MEHAPRRCVTRMADRKRTTAADVWGSIRQFRPTGRFFGERFAPRRTRNPAGWTAISCCGRVEGVSGSESLNRRTRAVWGQARPANRSSIHCWDDQMRACEDSRAAAWSLNPSQNVARRLCSCGGVLVLSGRSTPTLQVTGTVSAWVREGRRG
jgi:hypothetical protein